MFMLFCALLHLNLALEEDPIVGLGRVGLGYGGRVGGWGLGRGVGRVWDDEEVEEDPIVGLGRVGLGYGGRVGGWGLGRGAGRVWDDEETEEDPIVGLGRWGGLGGLGGRVGGWGLGRGVGRVWDDEEDIENDEDAVVGLRGMGRMGHLGMGHRLGLGLHGLRSHRMGLHGLGMLGRRHGMGRGLLNEDESEDVENDATLGRRMKVMGCKGLKCMRRMRLHSAFCRKGLHVLHALPSETHV